MTNETKICLTCQNPDGTPNTDELEENSSCVFGCGRKINEDIQYCPECKDNSNNNYVCNDCNATWDKWSGKWALEI